MKGLVVGVRNASSQSLVFDPSVQEASLVSPAGMVAKQGRGGSALVMPLQGDGSQFSLGSGLWPIQMKDDDGKTHVKALVVVK